MSAMFTVLEYSAVSRQIMGMVRRAGLCLAAIAFAVLLAGPARAEEPTEAEKTLDAKGLERSGTTWVVKEERTLRKEMIQLRRKKADFDRVQREHKAFERKIAKVKGYIANLQYQITEAEKAGRDAEYQKDYNKAVDLRDELIKKVEDISREKAEKENEMAIKIDKAQGGYVQQLMDVMKLSKQADAKYAELAKDKDVTDALEAINKDANRPYELGPSRVYQRNARLIERWGEGIQAGELELRKDGNTLWIDVVINNQARREMVVDTGADQISLPHDFAVELGIEATEKDEMIKLQMADGRVVDARKKTLESVQVGKFIVQDVECVVLPRDLIAATPLLGGSFLKHFTYHIDPERGRIRLSRTEGPVAEKGVDQMPAAESSSRKPPQEKKAPASDDKNSDGDKKSSPGDADGGF